MAEPRMIRNHLKQIDASELDGDLDDVIEYLENLKSEYSNKELELEFESDCYGEENYFIIYERHLETEEEMWEHRFMELKAQQEEERYEREQYLKLKAKFEGKVKD